MRITLVNESFDPARGGAERCALALGAALAERGHEVTRISRDPDRSRVAGALALAREAERARDRSDAVVSLCKAPGDVLYPQEGVHLAAVAGSLARYGPLVRPVAAVGKLLSPRQWAFLAAEGGAARPSAWLGPGAGRRPPRRYLALSRRIRDDMVRLWDAPPEAIEVCPNGVDCERFRPASPEERAGARRDLGARDDEVLVLFVSNNFALRGLNQLVHALALLGGASRDRPFRLVVAGRGAKGHGERETAALGVAATFAGDVEDVRPLLRAADVFALPTFYDACSLSTLEALAAGVPVVTSRANGASELLTGREGAVIEDARSLGSIAAALARLRDPARRADCAAAARETALEHPIGRAVERAAEAIEAAAAAGG